MPVLYLNNTPHNQYWGFKHTNGAFVFASVSWCKQIIERDVMGHKRLEENIKDTWWRMRGEQENLNGYTRVTHGTLAELIQYIKNVGEYL